MEKKTNYDLFKLLKDIESLSIENRVVSNEVLNGIKNDDLSCNEEKFFDKSPSIEYFRSSSGIEESASSNSLNNKSEEEDYFKDSKIKFKSKNSFIPNDFVLLSSIGNGAYSKVIKVKNKNSNKVYAVKIFDKNFMKKENKFYQIYVENEVLNMCDNSNIIKIYGSYESEENIYLVLEYCPIGNLSCFISSYCKLIF